LRRNRRRVVETDKGKSLVKIKKQNSFTLIELIVVIAIIAILAAVIAPNAYKAIEKAQAASIGKSYKSIKTSAMSYYVDTGLWYSGTDTCIASVFNQYCIKYEDSFFMIDSGDLGWDGPYLENPPSLNPWGELYVYMIGLGMFFSDEVGPPPYNNVTRVVSSKIDDGSRQLKIDAILDDGNLLTGAMRNSASSNNSGGSMGMLLLLVSSDVALRAENPESNP